MNSDIVLLDNLFQRQVAQQKSVFLRRIMQIEESLRQTNEILEYSEHLARHGGTPIVNQFSPDLKMFPSFPSSVSDMQSSSKTSCSLSPDSPAPPSHAEGGPACSSSASTSSCSTCSTSDSIPLQKPNLKMMELSESSSSSTIAEGEERYLMDPLAQKLLIPFTHSPDSPHRKLTPELMASLKSTAHAFFPRGGDDPHSPFQSTRRLSPLSSSSSPHSSPSHSPNFLKRRLPLSSSNEMGFSPKRQSSRSLPSPSTNIVDDRMNFLSHEPVSDPTADLTRTTNNLSPTGSPYTPHTPSPPHDPLSPTSQQQQQHTTIPSLYFFPPGALRPDLLIQSNPHLPSGSYLPPNAPPYQLTSAGVIVPPGYVVTRKKGGRFVCTYPGCNKSYTAKFSLKRHEKKHTGEKLYTCDQGHAHQTQSDHAGCGKAFPEKWRLKRHQKLAGPSEQLRGKEDCTEGETEKVKSLKE